MTSLRAATDPFAPFRIPVLPPSANWNDAPMVCISINEEWATYLLGAAQALAAESTWAIDDENVMRATLKQVDGILEQIEALEACPVPIQFRVDPLIPQNWQYSLDGGTSWLDGPDVASHYTPSFITDGSAPGAYDLTVNGGLSDTAFPLLTAFDPEAIIKDPATAIGNTIVAASGIDGLLVGTLAHAGVILQNNGISAFFQKVPGLGLAADTVVAIKKAADYEFPLLALLP